MLSPEVSKRLDQLLALHEKQRLTEVQLAIYLANLAKYLPAARVQALKRETENNECLCPEDSPLSDMFARYHREVGEALLEASNFRRHGLISVVCLPSFEPEWGLRLLGSEKTGFTLALNIAAEQIWGDMLSSQTAPVRVTVRGMEAPLPMDLKISVCEAWRKMLFGVRHARGSAEGLDGVTYHFKCRDAAFGQMAGKTWSPQVNTAPSKLVALSQLLYRYVDSREIERDRVADEIRAAADWFQRLP